MKIAWGALGEVFIVSFGSAVLVVVLLAFAMVGLSSRAPVAEGATPRALSSGAGTAVAAVCLIAAAAIALFGLYMIVSA